MFDISVTKRDGKYVASCEATGSIATGSTKEEAVETLKEIAQKRIKDIVPIYQHLN